MKKIKNTKGFTLMEMLIVVAIIAILIAIAIPTFNSSLNKAKVATDEANIRSGYASVMAEILASSTPVLADGETYTLYSDGSVVAANGTAPTGVAVYKTKGKPSAAVDIGGHGVGPWQVDQGVTYTVENDTEGGYTITIKFN